MTEPGPTDDRWLTVAEIAEELRVNPATVRLWISKALLPAKRAGRRKLLVRRSDLDEMLRAQEQVDPAPIPSATVHRPSEDRPLASVSRIRSTDEASPIATDDRLAALRLIQAADDGWKRAVDASVNAPPDPSFALRVQALAGAAEAQARAMARMAATPRMRWNPTSAARGLAISYELRPGGNRPGPPPLWEEFDRCVERLTIAIDDPDVAFIASSWQDLAQAMYDIADALLDDSPEAWEHRH